MITPRAKTAKVHHQSKSKEIKSEKIYKCAIYSGQHYTALCMQYQAKPVKQKLELIQKHELCYNCLGNHTSSQSYMSSNQTVSEMRFETSHDHSQGPISYIEDEPRGNHNY